MEIGAWIGGMLLLLAAANLRNPYFLPVRADALPVVFAVGILALTALSIWRPGRRGAARWALVALWVAAPAWALWDEVAFERDKRAVLAASDEPTRVLGRRFIVGYTSIDEIALLADRGLIGGVYLGPRAVVGRSQDILRDEIALLQRRRERLGLPPLIIAAEPESAGTTAAPARDRHLTADLTLEALDDGERCAAALDALSAGNDLLLLGYDPEQFYPTMRCVRAAMRQGRIALGGKAVAVGR